MIEQLHIATSSAKMQADWQARYRIEETARGLRAIGTLWLIGAQVCPFNVAVKDNKFSVDIGIGGVVKVPFTHKPNEEKYMVTATGTVPRSDDAGHTFFSVAQGEYTDNAVIGEVAGHVVGKALRAGVLDNPDFKITLSFQQLA